MYKKVHDVLSCVDYTGRQLEAASVARHTKATNGLLGPVGDKLPERYPKHYSCDCRSSCGGEDARASEPVGGSSTTHGESAIRDADGHSHENKRPRKS